MGGLEGWGVLSFLLGLPLPLPLIKNEGKNEEVNEAIPIP